MPVAKFVEAWTGIVLLAESSEKSGEPDYKKHRKTALIDLLKKVAFFFASGFLLLIAWFNHISGNSVNQFFGYSIMLSLNLAGLYISWLLLLKQMHIDSQYADKICSLFKQKDCNNVLESEAAKLFRVFGWSEIGFGYFLTNVLILLLAPALITSIALLNILTLPYSFWSVWYQKAKARQWCVLCLIVQVLLWAICIIDWIFGYIQLPALLTKGLIPLLIVGSCYFAFILLVNLLIPKLNTEKTMQSLKQSINSIQADEDVFLALLKKQPFYETNDCDSVIRFGNPDSKLRITVFSNPYCNPCAKMHKKIEELIHRINNEISVQYILSSFRENLNSTNKYLIASCLEVSDNAVMQILSDWFEQGKQLKDDYFKNLSLKMDNPQIEVEFQKHEAWKTKTQIRATPTILVNGYKLPDSYKIEDLHYFTNLDL